MIGNETLKSAMLENERFRILGLSERHIAAHQFAENKLVRIKDTDVCELSALCKLADEQWWRSILSNLEETDGLLRVGDALLRAAEDRGLTGLKEIEAQGVKVFPKYVFRKNLVPALYTRLGFVRKSRRLLADCSEDLPDLRKIQNVVAGSSCLSELEREPEQVPEFIVKAEFPDEISSYTGDSGKAIEWRCYSWKVYDVEKLFKPTRPAEAVALREAGIEEPYLTSLADAISCIGLLRDTQDIFQNKISGRIGYSFTAEIKSEIQEAERTLFAGMRITDMKERLEPPSTPESRRTSRLRSISPKPKIKQKLRHEVLQRDRYRCIFCGKDSSVIEIEVDHVIPRNLIENLNLDSKLHTASKNLCSTCSDCNRGKGGRLAKKDIKFYLEKFADAGRPNHEIIPYLSRIAELQTL